MADDERKQSKPVVEPDDLPAVFVDQIPEHRLIGTTIYLTLGSSVNEYDEPHRVRPALRGRMTIGFAIMLRDLLSRDIEDVQRQTSAREGSRKN